MRLVYPPGPVAIRLEGLGRLRQALFDRCTAVTVIECKGGDVDQCRNVWIIAGLADDGPAVAMADQYDRPAHSVDGGPRVLLVVGVRGLWGLRNRHRVAILLKDLRDGFPAGAIGKCAMHEDHVLDASRRGTRRGS